MAKAEASVEELVSMIERGELRLPEMQRQYVWRSTRVRDLLDSLYRGYPSGAILLWETDEAVPLQDFAVSQSTNPYQSTRLLLDGQQRLTTLSLLIAYLRKERSVALRQHVGEIDATRKARSNRKTGGWQFRKVRKRGRFRFQNVLDLKRRHVDAMQQSVRIQIRPASRLNRPR